MQKKSLFFFSFPSASNFNEVKVTHKRVKSQIYLNFFEREDSGLPPEHQLERMNFE